MKTSNRRTIWFLWIWIFPLFIYAQNIHYDYIKPEEFRPDTEIMDETFQVVLDVEDASFEFLSGDWELEKSGNYLGYYYFTIGGPGTGEAKGRWIAEGLPEGNYNIEYYVQYGNYAADARYQIICADGIHNITSNMNYLQAGWKTLGAYPVDRVCVVNISDFWYQGGTELMVDAIRFTLQGDAPDPPVSEISPHIGICIDDAGGVNPSQPGHPIYRMLRLPFKMTFAVMPNRSYTNETAAEIYNRGSEVILHQPMGYISDPNPGSGWINDNMSLEEVRAEISKNLDALPHIAGMNNHTGSLVTQQRDKMQVCMEELKKRNLFFYDSRTYTKSVAYDVAKENGLLTGERDLFIDGSSQSESMALIRSLAERALYAPHVPHLAIGHVRTGTAAALEDVAPELQAMGVEVWPISRCMSQVIEADLEPDGCTLDCTGSWVSSLKDRYSKELRDGICRDSFDGKETISTAKFKPSFPYEGEYDVYSTWCYEDDITTGATVRISGSRGEYEIPLDQSESFPDWKYLGRHIFSKGNEGEVEFLNADPNPGSFLRIDAVKFTYAGEAEPIPDMWLMY